MIHTRLLLTACFATVGAVVSPLGTGVAVAQPIADFDWAPKPVVAGTTVTFTSTSIPTNATATITRIEWNLDGHGGFETRPAAGSITATATAPAPGDWTVAVRVWDSTGRPARASKTITVQAAAPPPPPPNQPPPALREPLIGPTPLPRILSPFPIVRLAGSVTELGTEIRLLAVRAPKGARALVRCLGRGCPLKRAKKVVARHLVRFAGFKSLMPAGVVLEVRVRRGDSIGKFTRFKLRQNRPPKRADGCLWPGTTRMAPCPVA